MKKIYIRNKIRYRKKQHTASSRGARSGLTSGSSSPRPSTRAGRAIPAAASACGDPGPRACLPAGGDLPVPGGRKASTPADSRARGT